MTARRLVPIAVAVTLVVLLGAAVTLALWSWSELHRPHAGWEGTSVEVQLENGLDAGTMLRRLGAAGVIRHPRLARGWIALAGGAEGLRAGEYRFERPASPLQILDRLRRGDVLLHPVTLPEGLVLTEVADRLVLAGFGPREALLAAFSDPSPVRDLDSRAEDLEGYLFPDTYHFPRGTAPGEIVATLVRRFREVAGDGYAAAAAEVGLDLREAVTLASLIERETSVPDERGRISRVFHNRLARGMRLECDPTVIYALHRAGREVGTLTYDDLRFESPWNTYVIHGLPAGPIANPGRESLIAAVEPDEGRDLYFVAAPGGGHTFSRSIEQHLAAVAVWRRYVRSSR